MRTVLINERREQRNTENQNPVRADEYLGWRVSAVEDTVLRPATNINSHRDASWR